MQSKRASKTHILSPPFTLLYSCISLHFFHATLSYISLFVVVCFLLQEIIFISQIFVFFLFFILPCSSSLYFMLPMCTAWRRPIVRHSDTACHKRMVGVVRGVYATWRVVRATMELLSSSWHTWAPLTTAVARLGNTTATTVFCCYCCCLLLLLFVVWLLLGKLLTFIRL